ncbi:MAG: hypothetical protein FJW40_07030 [Acidobacteria bacterium]|nr:hypothetical protein [Acidobacteriota bacterium]
MTRERLKIALFCYAALALMAWLTLRGPGESTLRLVTLIALGAFALKSWIAYLKQQQEEKASSHRPDDERA